MLHCGARCHNSGKDVSPDSIWFPMPISSTRPIVLAITGASGAPYAVRLLEVLLAAGRSVHLTISPSARIVFETEMGLPIDLAQFDIETVLPPVSEEAAEGGPAPLDPHQHLRRAALSNRNLLHYHHFQSFQAGIASGSFQTAGMVVCPCSMGTLASIAHGLSINLIHRAADVHLKERRPLILVPRETPLGSIALQNMKTLSDAGAVILPAMPGFYHRPLEIQDLIDFIVTRICDHLNVESGLTRRWGTDEAEIE